MTKKKYLVLAGFGASGFLSAQEVGFLYRVNPEECAFADPRKEWEFEGVPDGLTVLKPDPSGKYLLPEPRLRIVQ